MSIDASRLRSFFSHINDGDFDAIGEMLADDVVFEFPGRRFGTKAEGQRRVLVFLKQLQRLFDGGLEFTVHWAGMSGDRGVVQWTNSGRTKAGVDYGNRGVTVFTVVADQVARIEDYVDTELIAETWPG